MKRIAIDMDEVIADFNCKFIASFNARFSENITVADLVGKTVEQFRPQLLAEIVFQHSHSEASSSIWLKSPVTHATQ